MEGGSVLAPNTPLKQEDIQVCVMNQDLLVPILSRMCTTQNRALPGIDDLRDQVSTLLTLCKRSGDLVGIVEDTAGTLKKLSGFVKTKTRRREVSTVTWQHPEDKAGDWNFHNFLYVYSIDRQRTNALKKQHEYIYIWLCAACFCKVNLALVVYTPGFLSWYLRWQASNSCVLHWTNDAGPHSFPAVIFVLEGCIFRGLSQPLLSLSFS